MNEDIRTYISLLETKKEEVKLNPLPYKMDALAPILSKENVEYHYSVLSRGYVDRYNKKEGDPAFNLGGAKLHNLWWEQLKPIGGTNSPAGPIQELIAKHYNNSLGLVDAMIEEAMTIQGSGWVYLTKSGIVKTTANQTFKTDILLHIDMWEHSFMDYMPSKDAKKKYIRSIMKIIDWDVINKRL